MAADETITRDLDLDLELDEAWDAITERDALEAWLGERVEIDLRPGGTGVVLDDGIERNLVVEHVDDGRGWSFRWQSPDAPASTVTFTIAPRDTGGSRLTITETLSASSSATARADATLVWETRVACLWMFTMAFARVR